MSAYTFIRPSLAALALAASLPSALAAQYQMSSPLASKTWPAHDWNGAYAYPKVYCLNFPDAKNALGAQYALFNNNTIHMVTVAYPEFLGVSIVVSHLAGRSTPKAALAQIYKREQKAEQAYGVKYHLQQLPTSYGPALGLRINNIAEHGSEGPFPLVRAVHEGQSALRSMSVHRHFVLAKQHIEIGLIQRAKEGESEAQMAQRLGGLADQLLQSLQSCTIKR